MANMNENDTDGRRFSNAPAVESPPHPQRAVRQDTDPEPTAESRPNDPFLAFQALSFRGMARNAEKRRKRG